MTQIQIWIPFPCICIVQESVSESQSKSESSNGNKPLASTFLTFTSGFNVILWLRSHLTLKRSKVPLRKKVDTIGQQISWTTIYKNIFLKICSSAFTIYSSFSYNPLNYLKKFSQHIVVCIVTWDFLGKFENPMSTRQELLHLTLPHVQIGGVCFQQRDVRSLQCKISPIDLKIHK